MTQPGLKTFTSKRFDRVTYTFDLDGTTYYATPGKEAEVQLAIINGAGNEAMPGHARSTTGLLNWLYRSISKAHVNDFMETVHTQPVEGCSSCEIQGRLRKDPEDDPLDLDTVLDVANWLIGELGKRPTTSSNAS